MCLKPIAVVLLAFLAAGPVRAQSGRPAMAVLPDGRRFPIDLEAVYADCAVTPRAIDVEVEPKDVELPNRVVVDLANGRRRRNSRLGPKAVAPSFSVSIPTNVASRQTAVLGDPPPPPMEGDRPRTVGSSEGFIAEQPFTVHWGAWSSSGRQPPGEYVDYQQQFRLTGTHVQRDVKLVLAGWFGLYPEAGLHIVEEDPTYMGRHLAEVRRSLDHFSIPRDFAGYIVIDYEAWWPFWDYTVNEPSTLGPDAPDRDFKDDWRDYIRSRRAYLLSGKTLEQQEDVFRSTWDDAARRFWLATIREGKRVRPNATWGFYGVPLTTWHYRPELKEQWRVWNETRYNWLYDEVDALFPSIYTLWPTCEGQDCNTADPQYQPEWTDGFIRERVERSVHLAKGKTVLPFIWPRYHNAFAGDSAYQLLSDHDLRNQILIPKEAGASGIIIWDDLWSPELLAETQQYFNVKMVPLIEQVTADNP